MVRPNQIVNSDPENKEFEFIMFARSEETVQRRVLAINFPSIYFKQVLFGDKEVQNFITNTTLVSEGRVNRYTVTLKL